MSGRRVLMLVRVPVEAGEREGEGTWYPTIQFPRDIIDPSALDGAAVQAAARAMAEADARDDGAVTDSEIANFVASYGGPGVFKNKARAAIAAYLRAVTHE